MPSRSAVERRVALERGVEQVEHVREVDAAHRAFDRRAVRLAVAGTASRVAEHDRVAGVHVHLHFVEQVDGVLGIRPAVDEQQRRMRAGAGRLGDPAVQRVAVTCGRCEFLGDHDAPLAKRLPRSR